MKQAYLDDIAERQQAREDARSEAKLKAKRAMASMQAAKRAQAMAKKAQKKGKAAKTDGGSGSAAPDDEGEQPLDEDLADIAAKNPALAAMLGKARRGFEASSSRRPAASTSSALSKWPGMRKAGSQMEPSSSSAASGEASTAAQNALSRWPGKRKQGEMPLSGSLSLPTIDRKRMG